MKDALYVISTLSLFIATGVLMTAYFGTSWSEMAQGMLWGAGLTIAFVGWACLFAAVCKEGFGPQA